jgi:hypothetical protein
MKSKLKRTEKKNQEQPHFVGFNLKPEEAKAI